MVKRRGPGPKGPPKPKNSRNEGTSDAEEMLENLHRLINLRDRDSDSDSDGEDKYELNQRTPEHTLADLKGIDEIKQTLLKSIILPFSFPEQAAVIRKAIPKGIPLTGFPGTGKTAMADAIVREIRRLGADVNFYRETGACVSKWVGESEANLRKLFKVAKENSPPVIFIDELDSLGRSRDDERSHIGGHFIVTALLTETNDLTPGPPDRCHQPPPALRYSPDS